MAIMADTLGGAMMPQKECFLILGGAGLVGRQIARRIATDDALAPRKIVIASLFRRDVESALEDMRNATEGRPIEWTGEHGNIFVRHDFEEAHTKVLVSIPVH